MQAAPGPGSGFHAQEISGGHLAFRALMFGTPHPGTVKYMDEQYERVQQISPLLNEAGQQFYAQYQQAWQEFSSAEAIRLARAALGKVESALQPNVIRSMWELPHFQNASPINQRFIMANPVVRELFHAQRLDGFSNSYVDYSPKDIGESHYDYRRVIDGIVRETADGGWQADIFVDDVREGDHPLTIDQQTDAINSWNIIEWYLSLGEDDPTSQSGGKL